MDIPPISQYNISYVYNGPCLGVSDTPNLLVISGEARNLTLSGLEEYSTYSINLTAIGESVNSETVTTSQTTLQAGMLFNDNNYVVIIILYFRIFFTIIILNNKFKQCGHYNIFNKITIE